MHTTGIRTLGIWRRLGLTLAAAAGLLLALAVVLSARAAPLSPPTFVVNSTSDAVAAGPLGDTTCATVYPYVPPLTCTLRAAIMKANHYPGGGVTITFDPAATNGFPIVLNIIRQVGHDDETNGDLNISQTTRLVGNGAGLTIIDAQPILDRVFWIEPGAVVNMSGLTVQNGRAGQFGGGGLYVDVGATLRLDDGAVLSNTDNSGLGGGGLLNGGTLTLTASLLGNNRSSGSGGGVENDGGRVTILASTLISNQAGGVGGGLLNFGPSLSLIQSSLISNTASVHGGGLGAEGSGETDVIASTVTANLANGDGGGLEAFAGQTNVINSTFSNNSAVRYGGGIEANVTGAVSLYNATVAGNHADLNLAGTGKGGGLSIAGGGAISLQNSLIADNYASIFLSGSTWIGFRDDCFGAPTSAGYNLLTFLSTPDIHTCNLAPTVGDVVTTTDHLGLLQANGGPTWTQALLPGSAAIDAGNPGGCVGPAAVPLTTDQRGDPRVANGAGQTRCDMGAYEVQRIVDLPLVRR